MQLKYFCLLMIMIALQTAGQILFKISSSKIEFSVTGILKSFFVPQFFLAIMSFGAMTFLWVYVLKGMSLRLAFPIVALTFFTVPLASRFFLNEHFTWNTVLGAILIMCGVAVSVSR